jgi:hypothetical protein
MSNLLLQLVKALVKAMVELMTPDKVKEVIDKAFDSVEAKVKDSKTNWDDVIVLPMLKALRKALDIPE